MPFVDAHVFDITRVIQLAVAPVFLLTAIGTIINALTGRLARAVDRRRVIEERVQASEADSSAERDFDVELKLLARRISLMLWSIGFLVTFLFGGLTGVILATPPLDFQLSPAGT